MAETTLTESNAAAAMDAAAATLPGYPGGFEGRGVVVPGGGMKYFPCAWVCLRMLREVGCTLPVELWHLGPGEITEEMRRLVEPLGVTCVDGEEVRQGHPARVLNGWELKCYSILHSRFREVLLLDADNFPLVDPTFLFDAPQYRQHGAVFWPDYGRLAPDRLAWQLTGIPYRDEPEFESGQVLVDKSLCWRPMSLAMWMNEHSDFWYRYVHGDKETFHLAWRKLGAEYAMPTHPLVGLSGVMCQHDFEGRRILQHRNSCKWTLHGNNPRVPGFLREEEGLAFLEELRQRWTGLANRYNERTADEAHRRCAAVLCARRWLYRRVGYDQRPMTFLADGSVGEGAERCERAWTVTRAGESWELSLIGDGIVTCRLQADGPAWRGRWLIGERMEVELGAEEGERGGA